MGQLCFREQEFRNNSKNINNRLSSKLIEKDPSKVAQYGYRVENFENTTNEKKYFYSMFFYDKIQKKIQKIYQLSKKRSHEVSPSQIQKLCASLGQYILYLQTIQENFQLYDQVYEESEKGYLESEAYSLTFEDSLRNANFSYQQNSNGQTNNLWAIGGLSQKKLNIVKQEDEGNNNEITESENSEPIDNNQSTQSTSNCNQIIPKFDAQEIKEHLNIQRRSALNIQNDNQLKEDNIESEKSEPINDNQKQGLANCDQTQFKFVAQEVQDNIFLQNKSAIQNINDQQNEDEDVDKIINREPVSCKSVLLYDMGNDISERSNINQNNNNSSGHFSNCDREQNLQTISEEGGQGNILFNSHLQSRNSILQMCDSNILSQISINDLQNALPNYEVSEIFGRISERLEQPLLIVEFHKLTHFINTKVASYRVSLDVLFEDGGKNQKLKFFTVPLYQAKTQGDNFSIPDIDINEVFEFMSEIHLTNSSYTKFRISIYYIPLNKQNGNKDIGSKLNNKTQINSPPKDKSEKSNKGSIGSNNGDYNENKQVTSSASSQSSSNSNLAYKYNSNSSQTTNVSNNIDNIKNIAKYNKVDDKNKIEDSNFKSQQVNNEMHSDEIKISSQSIDLKDYMDQKIHYLNLKFTNKSIKQKQNTNSINLTLQGRFQFVYDQISLVNNLMSDLNQQKSILEEVLTNLNNPTTITNNQK